MRCKDSVAWYIAIVAIASFAALLLTFGSAISLH